MKSFLRIPQPPAANYQQFAAAFSCRLTFPIILLSCVLLLSGCFSAIHGMNEWGGKDPEGRRQALTMDVVTLPVQAPVIAALGVLAAADGVGNKLGEKDRFAYTKLKAQVRADPEIVIREHWHASKDHKRQGVLWDSLSDPQTPYTADQLEKISAIAPRLKRAVFAHPACRPEFLASHFEEAKANYMKDHSYLVTLMANPSMPIELIEEIAESGNKYWLGREAAKAALSRRLPDSDGDKLPDSWEIREGLNPMVADAYQDDSDHDGLSNYFEYLRGLHPTNPDSDGDALPDGFEDDNLLNALQPLSESDQVPVPINLQAYTTENKRWGLRWFRDDRHKYGFSYLVYRNGKIVLNPKPPLDAFFFDVGAQISGEYIYHVRTCERGAYSRLSAGLRVKIKVECGVTEILEQTIVPN